MRKNAAIAWALHFLVLAGSALAQPAQPTATVTVDANAPAGSFSPALLGTNFTASRNTAAEILGSPAFIDSVRRLAPAILRWPGGNNADHFDWKQNEIIAAGRRRSVPEQLNLDDIVVFAREIGAELSITINFGTMHADDAADMVEFCNGPGTSFWGQKRDSILTAHGFAPGPLDVRYFEIGNETYSRHMFQYSWTAMHPAQYFLGGEAERRGTVSTTVNGRRVHLPLGDLFEIRPGDRSTTYWLRFPPVKNVTVRYFADSAAVTNCIIGGACTFETLHQVESLSGQPAGARVFVLDSLSGRITFGDGSEGFRPPVGSFILAEYTTTGHDGFVAFARKMRQVPSSVPIRIGATMLPDHPTLPDSTYVPADSLRAVYEQMDFLVLHHYLPTNSPGAATYNDRRQIAADRVQEQDDMFRRFRDASFAALGQEKEIGLAITEWNVFNKGDSLVAHNRALEAAVIGAEWLARTIDHVSQTPVFYAEQFELAARGSRFALIDNESAARRVAPLGYVFSGLQPWHRASEWLAVTVQSPQAEARDRLVPLVQAAAVQTAGRDTLLVLLTNNSEHDSIACSIELPGFTPERATVRRLAGATPLAHNDGPANAVLLSGTAELPLPPRLVLPPHSVAFVAFYAGAATAVTSTAGAVPQGFALLQNYPNPFTPLHGFGASAGGRSAIFSNGVNPETTIRYQLAAASDVELAIFDVTGRRVRTLVRGRRNAGQHSVTWDGRDDRGRVVASGVYLYRLQAGGHMQVRRMVVVW